MHRNPNQDSIGLTRLNGMDKGHGTSLLPAGFLKSNMTEEIVGFACLGPYVMSLNDPGIQEDCRIGG